MSDLEKTIAEISLMKDVILEFMPTRAVVIRVPMPMKSV
jgi:hypothetical protein